jgi:hypothetical protein
MEDVRESVARLALGDSARSHQAPGSLPATAIVLVPDAHGRQRREEDRKEDVQQAVKPERKDDLQQAVKHGRKERANPGTLQLTLLL